VLLITVACLVVAVVALGVTLVAVMRRDSPHPPAQATAPAPAVEPSALEPSPPARTHQQAEADARRLREAEEARRAAAEAEARRAEQERQERAARMAGAIQGGAWVIKGGGQSELIRGLTVYVLKPEVPASSVASQLRDLSSTCTRIQAKCLQTADEWSRPVPFTYGGGYSDMTSYVPSCRSRAAAMEKAAQSATAFLSHKTPLDVNTLFMMIRDCNNGYPGAKSQSIVISNIKADAIWPGIMNQALVAKGTTGIDGKYSIQQVPPGQYLVYARTSTAFFLIEWCQETKVTGGQSVQLDFFNDNAYSILNRDD